MNLEGYAVYARNPIKLSPDQIVSALEKRVPKVAWSPRVKNAPDPFSAGTFNCKATEESVDFYLEELEDGARDEVPEGTIDPSVTIAMADAKLFYSLNPQPNESDKFLKALVKIVADLSDGLIYDADEDCLITREKFDL